ncbi:MAG: Hsp20/alpha crystallin family protein [Candidatus Bilamarchaeaceae archaeon]
MTNPLDFGARVPLVEISEEGDDLIITVEIPGLEKGDVDINIGKRFIDIRGERSISGERSRRNYYYSEMQYAAIYRRMELPLEVEPDTAKATYKNGTVEVRVKKARKNEKVKRIKVQ